MNTRSAENVEQYEITYIWVDQMKTCRAACVQHKNAHVNEA